VIAEQHLSLTETFNSPWHFPDSKIQADPDQDFVGEVFLRCNAKEVVERCGKMTQDLLREANGSCHPMPEIKVMGHLDATFPYILSHLEYVIGELLRNSLQAVSEKYKGSKDGPPPIEVLICEAPQHVIIRISDQGGGIPREILPHLWSFTKGPRSKTRLKNLGQVPKMAATLQELRFSDPVAHNESPRKKKGHERPRDSSLSSLTSRPPNLRLGMGLPMSRVYAEYWAGSLELHSLEGYGVDAFLQISKLGNKNEQLSTRASMDAV
jgi:pyruvate dehydrogenase kinase 2/3/4